MRRDKTFLPKTPWRSQTWTNREGGERREEKGVSVREEEEERRRQGVDM